MRESDARTLAALRKWSVLLDSAFRVPGTNFKFGLDPLLGLVPGIGDLTTPFFATLLLLHAVRLRIPRVVQLRMLMNAAIDLGIGVVPVVGDLFDFGWKANVRNLALLERHAHAE
jgi:C4-dicarboxylate transporter